MIGYEQQKAMVMDAMKQFPAEFGLKAFPGEKFRVSLRTSYVNDSGVVMLYTERLVGDKWLDFAKGTVTELTANMVVAAADHGQCVSDEELAEEAEEHPTTDLQTYPFSLFDDDDDTITSCHGHYETLHEARGAATFDNLNAWTIYHKDEIVASYDPKE
jgi:hypothetical protein